ncbi:hypothetical protein OROMI_022945 [Orobanche minor]
MQPVNEVTIPANAPLKNTANQTFMFGTTNAPAKEVPCQRRQNTIHVSQEGSAEPLLQQTTREDETEPTLNKVHNKEATRTTRQTSRLQSPATQAPATQNVNQSIQNTSPVAQCSGSVKQKVRGPTYMKDIWGRPNCLGKIEVVVDDDGLPMSANTHMSEFLGTLARNGTYCPTDLEIWPDVRKAHGSEILEVIQQRYNLPDHLEALILKSIGKKWRNWKAELKAKYYNPALPISEAKSNKDIRVVEDQWIKLWTRWGTEEAKVLSNKKKIARNNKKMNHTTGKKPFAAFRGELAMEKGRIPSRVELFDKVYARSDGNSSSVVVNEKLEAMKAKLNELPPDYDDSVGPNDVFSQVMGKDKPGYVRLYGGNVTPNDLWTETPSRSKLLREKIQQHQLLKNLAEQVQHQSTAIAQLQLQIAAQKDIPADIESPRYTSAASNNVTGSCTKTTTLREGRHVLMMSMIDMKRIVAKGVLLSVDPKSVVGGYELGDAWYEVHVKVPVVHKERLIRPHLSNGNHS